MPKQVLEASYSGLIVAFTDDAWFNATAVASKFGKKPVEWLRLPETERYISALCRRSEVGKSHFTLTRKGNSSSFKQGTWFHPKLAVRFAQWLDMDFAIWCDEQIDAILRGKHPAFDWKRLRCAAAASSNIMHEVIADNRSSRGKESRGYHFSNEHRMVNHALTGVFCGLERDSMTMDELAILAKLEARNTILIARGHEYQERKLALETYAGELQQRQRSVLPANEAYRLSA